MDRKSCTLPKCIVDAGEREGGASTNASDEVISCRLCHSSAEPLSVSIVIQYCRSYTGETLLHLLGIPWLPYVCFILRQFLPLCHSISLWRKLGVKAALILPMGNKVDSFVCSVP